MQCNTCSAAFGSWKEEGFSPHDMLREKGGMRTVALATHSGCPNLTADDQLPTFPNFAILISRRKQRFGTTKKPTGVTLTKSSFVPVGITTFDCPSSSLGSAFWNRTT